ncbi:hypothetical protein B0H11DRAFT_2225915 [Mycena galericulata]|nr:hypothetical protein B0H11DRAFT_2225915 [Mycena galericulata]
MDASNEVTHGIQSSDAWEAQTRDANSIIDFDDLKPVKLFVRKIPFTFNHSDQLKEEFHNQKVTVSEAVIYRSPVGGKGLCGHIVVMSESQAKHLLHNGLVIRGTPVQFHEYRPKVNGVQARAMDMKTCSEGDLRPMMVTLAECRIVQLWRLVNSQNLQM